MRSWIKGEFRTCHGRFCKICQKCQKRRGDVGERVGLGAQPLIKIQRILEGLTQSSKQASICLVDEFVTLYNAIDFTGISIFYQPFGVGE